MTKSNIKEPFLKSFISRVRANKTSRWIRFGCVSLVFFLWVIWLGNPWVLPWWLLLFDIYITGYIPFTWWKTSKSAITRTVMSWVDAIVYALVLVYFIFAYVGQNYQIPSSSLEKTLLTGDYLWVNKMAYGPRVPMTPLHFPLAQNTMPLIGTKSYIEQPQWKYHRLKGYTNIKLGDIVVFNFPAGDSIALNAQNPDIYMLSRMIGEQLIQFGMAPFPTTESAIEYDAAVRALGMEHIRRSPEQYGEVMWRPVDRRENYVKRTVGLPGDEFQIIDGEIFTNGKHMAQPENVQFCYTFTHKNWHYLTPSQRNAFWDTLEVSKADRVDNPETSEIGVPLTPAMIEKLNADPNITKLIRKNRDVELLFPLAYAPQQNWTIDNYGPLTIPAKGMTINLTEENFAIYGHTIDHYEPHSATWKNGQAYIDGKPADTYTFEMDYYFMMGDNRHKSLDSRYWGFVPEDHIVGRPEIVLISLNPDGGGLFGIRWNRIFKSANN